jgi:hypothetical protein
VRLHDGGRVRDLNSYISYFLVTAHNALSRGSLHVLATRALAKIAPGHQ